MVYMDYNITCVIGLTTRHTSSSLCAARFFVFFFSCHHYAIDYEILQLYITSAPVFPQVGLTRQIVWIFGEISSEFVLQNT